MGKMEYLKMLFATDVGDRETHLFNKLTDSHLNEDKLEEKKSWHRIFSQWVSSVIRFSARHRILPTECKGTAEFLLIFDKLFDSFNGYFHQDDSKIYKSCIKRNFPLFQLSADLLPILSSIKFKSVISRNNVDLIKYNTIPSIKNWIANIRTFK